MMDLIAYFLTPAIGQMLCEYAGVCNGECCNDTLGVVRQAKEIGLAKQFVLIVLRVTAEEIVDVIPSAIKKLDVQFLFTELYENLF